VQLLEDMKPEVLEPAKAAVAWLNTERESNFHLTGLADADTAVPTQIGGTCELSLVLCDDDVCAREQVRVVKTESGFDVSSVEINDDLIPALLDPPVGIRSHWLDDQLEKFDFVLLLFYRGRW